MAFYVICDDDSKHEGMTKEQIWAAITQAASGSAVIDPDAGVLTKVKEKHTGGYITFWAGTQAQYNALLGKVEKNCIYIITDETTMIFNGKQMSVNATIGTETYTANAYVDENNVLRLENVCDPMVAGLEPRDVSAEVVYKAMYGGDNLSVCELSGTESYIKTLGIVFYSVLFVYKGTISEGEEIGFEILGNYTPKADSPEIAAASADGAFSASCVIDALTFRANKDISADSEQRARISGWYFCDRN